MSSPFPGFDPFLEDQGYWREFHTAYMIWMQYALADRLPDAYEVRIEERLSLAYVEDEAPYRDIQPDATILRLRRPSRPASAPPIAATLEPVLLALPRHHVEEVIEKRLSIRHLPNRELVTAIELLSPSNKRAPGDQLYDEKRQDLIDQEVHLVELDLLIGGQRLSMEDELPKAHYYAFVSRAERRPLSETYVWTIRDPLPTIPIPLKAPDADILLDLASIFATVYERAQWGRSIDYSATLGLPLDKEDRAWAESLARSARPPQARP
jgi:hypothetical protein